MAIVNRPARTVNQRVIREALSSCGFSLYTVAHVSGVSVHTLKNWVYKDEDPTTALVQFALEGIEKLGECPKRPDWSKEIITILEMRETVSVINIAKHYGVPTKNIHSLIYFYRKHPDKIKR